MLTQLIVDTPIFMAHWLSLTHMHIHICIYNICLTRFVSLDRNHPLTKRRGHSKKEKGNELPTFQNIYLNHSAPSITLRRKEKKREGSKEGKCTVKYIMSFLHSSCFSPMGLKKKWTKSGELGTGGAQTMLSACPRTAG